MTELRFWRPEKSLSKCCGGGAGRKPVGSSGRGSQGERALQRETGTGLAGHKSGWQLQIPRAGLWKRQLTASATCFLRVEVSLRLR